MHTTVLPFIDGMSAGRVENIGVVVKVVVGRLLLLGLIVEGVVGAAVTSRDGN